MPHTCASEGVTHTLKMSEREGKENEIVIFVSKKSLACAVSLNKIFYNMII